MSPSWSHVLGLPIQKSSPQERCTFPERSVWEQRSLHLQDLASRRSLRCCQHLGIQRSWRCYQSLVSQNLQRIQLHRQHVQQIGFQQIQKSRTALGKRTEILAEPNQKKRRRMVRTAFQSLPNLNVSLILIHLPTFLETRQESTGEDKRLRKA